MAISRRSFLKGAATVAAGNAMPTSKPCDQVNINKLLDKYETCIKDCNFNSYLLSADIKSYTERGYHRLFAPYTSSVDYESRVTSYEQKLRQNMEELNRLKQELIQMIGDKAFFYSSHSSSVPNMMEPDATGHLTTAVLQQATIPTEYQSVLDLWSANKADMIASWAPQQQCFRALIEAFPDDARAMTTIMQQLDPSVPRIKLWSDPQALIKRIRDNDLLNKHRFESPRIDEETTASLNAFFQSKFKKDGDTYVTMMTWPEHGDSQRFYGALQVLLARVENSAGIALPTQDFFEGKTQPHQNVTFRLPEELAEKLAQIISQQWMIPTPYASSGEVIAAYREIAVTTPKLMKEIALCLECIKSFGGGKWTEKINSTTAEQHSK